MKSFKIGLKIWSSNQCYLNSIQELRKEGFFDYVELFVEPDSSDEHLNIWRDLDVPFLLHAPHFCAGLNFSKKESEKQNRLLIHKVSLFEEGLSPEKVIFHPGTNGSLDEVIRQINVFQGEFEGVFKKAIIENKPKIGLKEEECIGASFDEVLRIKKETGCGFCLDMGHALSFSTWAKKNWEDVVSDMLKLEPEMFHLSDGDINDVHDNHYHYGAGNYDLKKIVSMIPDGSLVSVETNKDSKNNLDDFKEDVTYLKDCLKNGN